MIFHSGTTGHCCVDVDIKRTNKQHCKLKFQGATISLPAPELSQKNNQ
jgi:hypothetical protein